MAKKVLNNVEIFFPKLARPDSYKGGPERWTLQMRTRDEDTADSWEELGFTVKKLKDDDGNKFWRANVSRKVIKGDGERRDPVKLLDGSMNEIDPRTLGNGSVGNIQYTPWEMERDGETLSGRILEAVQVTTLKVYTPRDGAEDEGFSLVDTDVIPDNEADSEENLY